MYWNSFSDFLAMGTHGLYVWGSVIVTAVCLALEPVLVGRRHRAVLDLLRRRARAEQRAKSADARQGDAA